VQLSTARWCARLAQYKAASDREQMSASTYWKAPSYCLEEAMEVWLLSAAHMSAHMRRPSRAARPT
jgi:hypothetical protein